jgi:acetoin utilization protein AcuA
MEVSAIEVCLSWRSFKIASAILKTLVAFPQVEEKIVYMVGYSWTWDLSGTRKTAQLYRQMLINLYSRQEVKEYKTNEPNICLKSENLFMCRLGDEINQTIRDRFKWLRFGLSPWTWV